MAKNEGNPVPGSGDGSEGLRTAPDAVTVYVCPEGRAWPRFYRQDYVGSPCCCWSALGKDDGHKMIAVTYQRSS